jgi:rhomboid protease GluP
MLPQGHLVTLPPRLRWKLDHWREDLPRLFGGKGPPPRPRLCPACGQLVGATQNRCHQCGTSLTFSLAAVSRSVTTLLPEQNPVTKLIAGLSLFLYAVSLAATFSATQDFSFFRGVSGQVLFRLGSRDTLELIVGHQWWRLVMPIFLHANLLHIGMNMWVLVDLGPPLEELYGSARYLFLYIATGILGFVASTAWDIVVRGGLGSSVGASGAIMGLVGLHLAVCSQRGGPYFQMMRAQLIRWVIIIFAFGFFMGGIDNAAHFGGLVSGYGLGRLFADREPASPAERRLANLLSLAAILIVVLSFTAMFLHYSQSLS